MKWGEIIKKMIKGRPITPEEAELTYTIPPEVYDAFNSLLQGKPRGKPIRIKQTEVVELIVTKLKCERKDIFENHWLDVEEDYRKAGWTVTYDKPGFNECYDPYYKFYYKK